MSELRDFAAAVPSGPRERWTGQAGGASSEHRTRTGRPSSNRRNPQYTHCMPEPGARCLPCAPETLAAESCLDTGKHVLVRCYESRPNEGVGEAAGEAARSWTGFRSCDGGQGLAAFVGFEFVVLLLFLWSASTMGRHKRLHESEFSA